MRKSKRLRASYEFLLSYVCSLFTSIPLIETINIVAFIFEKKLVLKSPEQI